MTEKIIEKRITEKGEDSRISIQLYQNNKLYLHTLLNSDTDVDKYAKMARMIYEFFGDQTSTANYIYIGRIYFGDVRVIAVDLMPNGKFVAWRPDGSMFKDGKTAEELKETLREIGERLKMPLF